MDFGRFKEMSSKERTKLAVYLGLLGIIGLLYCNDNNNPTSFWVRIFPSYKYKSGEIFYIYLFMLLGISFILFDIYKVSQWRFLNSVSKRLIVAVFFPMCCMLAGNYGIQVCKSFQGNLDSIYLDRRDDMRIEYEWTTEERADGLYKVYSGGVYATLKNCSQTKAQSFKVRINPDMELDEAIAEKLITSEEMTLQPGEADQLKVISFDGVEEKVNEDSGGGCEVYSRFELILYNDEMSVTFLENN